MTEAEKHKQAERDYMLGMKYQDIADKYKVSINTVKSWKKRHEWKREVKKNAPQIKKKMHTKEIEKRVQNTPAVISVNDNQLTEKQKLFCLFYVKNFNATMSAIRAGYSKHTAMEQGYQLLQKTSVRVEVKRLKDIKNNSIMLSEDDIVERYMRIAFADMGDFAEWGIELVPAIDKAGCMLIGEDGNVKYHKVSYLDFKNHNEVDSGLISEISLGRQGMKVKLQDQQKALEWLSNYFNMNPMNKHKMQFDNRVIALREKESARDDW